MKFKFRPMFKDISLTFITGAIVLLGFFLIYRLIAKNFGPEGVGEYSLVKRTIGFLQPLLVLGLGVGLPRYIAMSRDRNQRATYMKVAGVIVGSFTFIFFIFINLFKDYFAKTFFGSIDYNGLVLPFSFFLVGLTFYGVVYSYFRGRLFVKTFNFLHLINLAIIPFMILTFFKNTTIGNVITFIGIAIFIISLFFSLSFIKELFVWIEREQFKDTLKELIRYSLPRVPADFILAGLFSLGPIFAVHLASIQEVGYLSMSQSLIRAIATAITPLGLILLPKVSNLIADGKEKIIKENLNLFIPALIQCSFFLCFQLIIFADAIVKFWLGTEFSPAVPIMRVTFISIIFYTFYVAMRSILDATKIKPLNTMNLFISFGVFMTIGGILLFLIRSFSPIFSLAIALTSAMVCLGILTFIAVRKIYPGNVNKDLYHAWIAIGINTLLGSVTILSKPFIISNFYYLIVFGILIGVIYLSILWLLKTEWIRQIPKIIKIT